MSLVADFVLIAFAAALGVVGAIFIVGLFIRRQNRPSEPE
jgi:hypothetical protein